MLSGITGSELDDTLKAMIERERARTQLPVVALFDATDLEKDGQAPGTFRYCFQLMPLDDTVTDAALQRAQDALAAGVQISPVGGPPDRAQASHSFLRLTGETLCYSTMTVGPGKQEATVRVYNLSDTACPGALHWLTPPVSATRVTLDGKPVENLVPKGGRVPIHLGPWEIGTYTLHFA